MIYVNPDVRGLLVDDVGLCADGHSLQTLLPQNRVIGHRDEEGWRQQNQLEFPLTAIQQNCPTTRTTSGQNQASIEYSTFSLI